MADALPAGERRQLAPPISETGALGWARRNLFSSWGNGITTLVLVVAVGWLLSWFVNWAILTAVFTATKGADCHGHGACWALIHEKIRLIFLSVSGTNRLALSHNKTAAAGTIGFRNSSPAVRKMLP